MQGTACALSHSLGHVSLVYGAMLDLMLEQNEELSEKTQSRDR